MDGNLRDKTGRKQRGAKGEKTYVISRSTTVRAREEVLRIVKVLVLAGLNIVEDLDSAGAMCEKGEERRKGIDGRREKGRKGGKEGKRRKGESVDDGDSEEGLQRAVVR